MKPFSPELQAALVANVQAALAEDVGPGDLTAQLIDADAMAQARVISREAAILCGQAWFTEAFRQIDPTAKVEWLVAEGSLMEPNQVIVTVTGKARALLTGERTGLNFLQLLSGTATVVRQHVDAIAGTTTKIVDSRKTIPGLRQAQKYAVTVGGGHNHRFALYDGILIKENHIATAGGVSAALSRAASVKAAASATNPFAADAFVQIEVETLAQLREALQAGAKMILLDNMDHAQIREAVAINAALGAQRAALEVSGGVSLQTVRGYAELGVDRISIGALTKHIRAVDFSMRMSRI